MLFELLPSNLVALSFKGTRFNGNIIFWQILHKLGVLLSWIIHLGTLTEGLTVHWKRDNLGLLHLEQVNCCLCTRERLHSFEQI